MIAVIFEVSPKADRYDDYLSIAEELRPLLEQIEGFISVERFQSLNNPDRILSLSFFELAVVKYFQITDCALQQSSATMALKKETMHQMTAAPL